MKVLLLALFVAVVTAVPIPEDSGSDAVELIVNGLPDGAALEVSDIVDIKLNEHADGEVVAATNLLHPYTAVGIAEATAAAAAAAPSEVNVVDSSEPLIPSPEPVVLPSPALPEVVPESVPSLLLPEMVVPEAVVLPSPAVPEVVVPEPIVLPSPAVPEVVLPESVVPPTPEVVVDQEQLPVAIPQVSGDLFNDGLVQVQYNGPEPSMLSTLQSWFNMVINYFNDSSDATQSISF